MERTVLVAEDDRDIIELLTLYLTGSGYRVLAASNGREALEAAQAGAVDIALVDIMMPQMNGYDFIKAFRQMSSAPVIIISARTQPADKIIGLDAGADGFISKPFDPLEVCAYIRAMLRRCDGDGPQTPKSEVTENENRDETAARTSRPDGRDAGTGSAAEDDAAPRAEASPRLHVGDLSFDTARLVLTRHGEPVALTAAELKIMAAFMGAPGRVFSKAQLYECISGDAYPGSEGSVMVHISNIRAKLEDDPLRPRYIKTVRGMGYRLEG